MEEQNIKTQKFIIKYFTEIMIKGDTAKRHMIQQLYVNLQSISSHISKDIKIKKFFDKIELETPIEFSEELKQKLLNTSGIQQVLEAITIENMNSLDDIKVEVNKHMANTITDKYKYNF
jgi:thiamine biosynthesis protein ThiI